VADPAGYINLSLETLEGGGVKIAAVRWNIHLSHEFLTA
jgi:hypothetical protein